MKTAITLILTTYYCAGLILSVKAQTWSIGPRFGSALTDIYGNGVDESAETRAGLLAGAVAELDFPGPFALQPEVGLIIRGFSDEIFFPESVSISAMYLDVNVLAKAKFSINNTTGIHILAGPFLGWALSDINIRGDEVDERLEFDDVGANRESFGVQFGTGLNFNFIDVPAFIDFRYHLGLNNILESDDAVRHSAYTVSGGLLIPLK